MPTDELIVIYDEWSDTYDDDVRSWGYEVPERLAALPDGVRMGLHLLLLIAFGIKAAVFPLFSWLPDSYPTAPSSASAVFAGLLTKVGVYCLIRV